MNRWNIDSLQKLEPTEFENLVKAVLIKMGFNATTTKASGDGGVDVLAVNEQPIIGGKYVIQCKRYATGNNVGEPVARELYGVMHAENANKGILITTSDFTKRLCKVFSANSPQGIILNGFHRCSYAATL